MSEPKSQVTFQELGLGSVLKHAQLVVPPHQREYAWTEREVTQLFRDFAKAISDSEASYFLGTIVTIPRHDGTLDVVDGQQRLATTAILLAAIRDYLAGKDDVLVEAINNEFLTGIDRNKRSRVPKLRLNTDDNDLFRWIISGDRTTTKPKERRASHRLLVQAQSEAAKHVKAIVSSHGPKYHGDLLNTWVSFVEDRAVVVLLRVPDDANAYKMFETLNDRGLRTSQADLIKNYLFGRSADRISEVQSRWSYMRGTLESLEEENITVDFLRHALISIKGFTRESQVYDTVQDAVKGEQAAIDFCSTLEDLSAAYVATFNQEHEKWNAYPDASRRALTVLNRLNIRPMRALLLSVALRLSPREASNALGFLVALGVRLLVASSTRSGSVELPLARAAHEVFSGTIKTARDLKGSVRPIVPTNQEFRDAFATARVTKAQLARYYLRCLEMAARNDAEPYFVPTEDGSIINLEHILPKKPESNWPQFTSDDAIVYVNRLGNQALMRATDNSNLRSAGFGKKRPLYGSSPYVLTSEIAAYGTWTTTAIAERQNRLADLAAETWPV